MYQDILTYEQKVALEAEIAGIISTSPHDGELLRRIYMSLKEVPQKYRDYVLLCFKNLTTLSDETFMKIQYEIQLDTPPLWIWIQKTVWDLKAALKLTNQEGVLELSTNKLELKKKTLESAFIMFCRKATVRSAKLVNDLCEAVMEERELGFLKTACINILLFLEEYKKEKGSDNEFLENILELELDIRETLSFKLELGDIGEDEDDDTEKKDDLPNVFTMLLDSLVGADEVSEEEVEEKRRKRKEIVEKIKEKKKKNIYTVVKVYKESGITSALKKFNTKKEAVEYIKKIKEEFPELKNTCSFCIEHEV